MADTKSILEARLAAAFSTVAPGADPVLRPSDRADFQSNGALSVAKQLGKNPREVAEAVLAAAELDDLVATSEIAGPGFINLVLRDDFVLAQVELAASDDRLGVPKSRAGRVIIDYSAPNVAKEMHAGHLRSTVIGDALARICAFVGYEVIRENHLGDWGTPLSLIHI